MSIFQSSLKHLTGVKILSRSEMKDVRGGSGACLWIGQPSELTFQCCNDYECLPSPPGSPSSGTTCQIGSPTPP